MASVPILTIRYKTFSWRDLIEPADLYAVAGMVLAAVCFVMGFFAGKL